MNGKKLKELAARLDDDTEVILELSDGITGIYTVRGSISSIGQIKSDGHKIGLMYITLSPEYQIAPKGQRITSAP